MKSGKKPHGFTIVEVMIFLVVTGAMLVYGVAFLRGRQHRVQFDQAVRETEAELRTIINEVASGYYPNKENFTCTSLTNSGPNPPTLAVGANTQGTNTGCVFLGKVVQFVAADSSDYNVFTVVGHRQTRESPPREVESLQGTPTFPNRGAEPITVTAPVDNTEAFKVPWGVKVSKVIVTPQLPASPYNVSAIGFILSFGQAVSAVDPSEGLVSGSQNVDLVPVRGDANPGDVKEDIKEMKDEDRRPKQVTICFSDGDSRSATITIGGAGRGLSTTTRIYSSSVAPECT